MEESDSDRSNDKEIQVKIPSEKEKFRSFLFLFGGQLISLFGSSIVMFSIIWWITIETESPSVLSITYFLSFAPSMILVPFAGVFVDRWNKKKIIIISDFLQAIFTLGIIILFAIGSVNLIALLILIVLRGLCQAFHQPTLMTIVPFMVPQKYLSKLNSISFLATGLLNIVAPLIAALLMVYLSIGQILWIDIITYSIALVPSIFLKLPIQRKKKKRKKKSKFIMEFKEGFATIKGISGLNSLILIFAVTSFFSAPFYVLMPYYIEVTHSGIASDYALVMASFQLGIILGSIIVIKKKNWNKVVLRIIQLYYFQFLGVLFILLPPIGVFWLIGIGVLIIGSVTAIINSIFITLLQTIIPPRKQGRVISLIIVISNSVSPLGMILSGFFADLLGIYIFFLFCALLIIGLLTIGVLFTNILNLDNIAEVKTKELNSPKELEKQDGRITKT